MTAVAEPENEAARLDALREYRVLDTAAEQCFDDLTALASHICETPVALVSLVDRDRQWFKSRVGLDVAETSREVAFCAHSILGNEVFVVPDATQDPRFADNPLVTSGPQIRFYAGAPLISPQGHAVGTLCVIDRRPRHLSPEQMQALRALGRQVVQQLEMRIKFRELLTASEDRDRLDMLRQEQLRLAAFNASVGHSLTTQPALSDMLRGCCNAMVEHLKAAFARIWILDPQGQMLLLQASAGLYTHLDGPHGRVPVGQFKIGLIAQEGAAHLTNDVLNDPRVGDKQWARREGMVSFAGHPLIVDQRVVGVMAMFAREPLTSFTLKALAASADGIALGVRRCQIDQQRLDLLDQLAAANKELSDFAYVVSHDLKAPLRGIGSLASWLSTDYGDQFDAEGREHLKLLTSRVHRMHGLIEGVLRYSRAGRSHEQLTDVDLNDIVEAAIDSVAAPAHIQIHKPGHLPIVSGERTKLLQVFQNLIGNAVKYMDKPVGDIHISWMAEDGGWHFAVRDNGPGIEERYFEKIFQLFQTLSTRDEFESSGVGLAVVKKIVEAAGGRIWVESTPGLGSAFHFILPKVGRGSDSL